MTPNIDHRQHLAPPFQTSLGISANTVHASVNLPTYSPLIRNCFTKEKRKRAAAKGDAVTTGRRVRYQLQRVAQGLLPGERVKHCQRSTMNDAGVGVYTSANGGAGFSNLATCGSVWHCPVCSAKITESRRKELQAAINHWAKQGGEVYLMSLTFPHLMHQRLKGNLDMFAKALKKFKNGRAYKNTMRNAGSAGSIRALEVTHGKNGWHPHTHDLVFAKPGQLNLFKQLEMVWIETLIKADLAERNQVNDMMLAAFDIQNGDYAAEYVAKFGHEASEKSKTLTDSHWTASNELTKGHAKVGKRFGGRTPFTLLLDYAEGDREAGELFKEFAEHFKGKRQLFWSPKLRKALAMEEEQKSDEEIAAEELPERTLVKLLYKEQWRTVLNHNARWQVLEAAAKGGAKAVDALLESLGSKPITHQGIFWQKKPVGFYQRGVQRVWVSVD